MQSIPQVAGSRTVPVQAAEGVMVVFTVREATLGDLKVAGFAEALGEIVDAVAGLGAAREAAKGKPFAAFVAPMGAYAVALSAVARADETPGAPRRPNGMPWRVEDLPFEALPPLIAAFDELNLTEGKVRALSALIPAMAPRLRAAMRAAVSQSGSPNGPESASTNSSAPGTPSPTASASLSPG